MNAREASDAAWRARQKSNGRAGDSAFIPLVRYADMQARLIGRPLIRGILEIEQISLVFGEAGCGKTFFALDMALHVAAGLDWFGRRVAQGAVIYVAAEAGAGIINRVAAWRQASGLVDLPFAAVTNSIDLCHPAAGDVSRLIDTIRAALPDPALLVIDTVSRALAGGNENAPDDMGALVRSLDQLRDELHCHVLAVHHAGKDSGRGSRGHSLLHCAIDTEIEVVRDATSAISTATITKQRDGPTDGTIAFRIRAVTLGTDDDGEPVTSCVVEKAETAPAAPRSKPLPPAQQRALDLLTEAINTAGEVPAPNSHIPTAVRCVPEATWRKYCAEGGVSTGGDRASRLAFQRAAEALLASRRIGKWGDLVWVS
jgi:KaiC/GvpD/RAD55 family RecA-like ATPase